MNLPSDLASRWSIDNNHKQLSVGDTVYYAHDGVNHRITDISNHCVTLYDTWLDETWTCDIELVENTLYSVFFPLSEK